MTSRVSRWVRKHPAITTAMVIGLAVLVSFVWTIIADIDTECVRWTTRIGRGGPGTDQKICVERRPRQQDDSWYR